MMKINLMGDMLVGWRRHARLPEEEAEETAEVGEFRGTCCIEEGLLEAFVNGDDLTDDDEGRLISVADKTSKDFLDKGGYRLTPMSLSARANIAESKGRTLSHEEIMDVEEERRQFEREAEKKLRSRGLYDEERWNERIARTKSLFFGDIPSKEETDNMREKACALRDKLEDIKEGANIENIEDLKKELKEEINNGTGRDAVKNKGFYK